MDQCSPLRKRTAHTGTLRLKRLAAHVLAALSAAGFVAVLALWVCSFFTAGSLIWDAPGRILVVVTQRNLIGVRLYAAAQSTPRKLRLTWFENPDSPGNYGLWDEFDPRLKKKWLFLAPRLGIGYYQDTSRYRWQTASGTNHSLYFPHWLAILILGIWPAWWYSRIWTRRRRARRGCCIQCGYDLRASPDRCPECGRQINT
jgi:hypothetical protein